MGRNRDHQCQIDPDCYFPSVFYCNTCSGSPLFYCEAHEQAHLSHRANNTSVPNHASKLIYKDLSPPQLDKIMLKIKSKLQAIDKGQKKVDEAVAVVIERINSISNKTTEWFNSEYAKTNKLQKMLLKSSKLYFQDEADLLLVNDREIKQHSKEIYRSIQKSFQGTSIDNEANPELTPVSNYSNSPWVINPPVRPIRDIIFSQYASNEFKLKVLQENDINLDIRAKNIHSVLILRNYEYAIIWKDKNDLVFCNLNSKKQSMSLEVPEELKMIAATNDSRFLITSSTTNSLGFWDIQTKELIRSISMGSRIDFIHQFPKNKFLLYGHDCLLYFYDLKKFPSKGQKLITKPKPTVVAHTKNYKTIIVGGSDGSICSFLVCLSKKQRNCTIENPKKFIGMNNPPTCLSLSNDDERLFAGNGVGNIGVWIMDNAKMIIFMNPGGCIVGIMPAEDNKSMLWANSKNEVKKWGIEDQQVRLIERRSEIDNAMRRNFLEIECFEEKLRS
jgi:WD40 repeat protein